MGRDTGPQNASDSSDSAPNDGAPTSVWASQGRHLGHGMTWATATLLFFLGGWWLDGRLGTTPWLSLLGAFTGGAAGFYSLYYHVIVEEKREPDRDSEDQA